MYLLILYPTTGFYILHNTSFSTDPPNRMQNLWEQELLESKLDSNSQECISEYL